MKIRQGFVSNSSSSSFVIIGFKSDYNEEEKFENGKFTQLFVDEYGDHNYITGYLVADGDPGDSDFDAEVSNISEKIKEISEEFNKDESEIKLYCGVRPS